MYNDIMRNAWELINKAAAYDYVNGVLFNEENYKWFIGKNVLKEMDDNNKFVISGCPITCRYLFSIKVMLDTKHDNSITLWRNITDI